MDGGIISATPQTLRLPAYPYALVVPAFALLYPCASGHADASSPTPFSIASARNIAVAEKQAVCIVRGSFRRKAILPQRIDLHAFFCNLRHHRRGKGNTVKRCHQMQPRFRPR